ncbi:holo-[acyl-carrier-protein] synthase [Trypanosoma conorhini]|uniref:Holo-[acyl-carrier-protein] synthase n=1 Tax=Trypanosoma conorhini TaxID=83891 RepID=A0A422NX75_9TRYP|nr:holo-[acyl-carrier-protein] synthase [Trypanosoma conorhini]RNF10015.1 holo-[acyl-carrier-protein] synthase [Trypanosoma conorhini]
MSLQRLSKVLGEDTGVSAFLAVAPVLSECISPELRKRAQLLHVNHQLPYVLSRLAASAALSSSLNASVFFVGAREEARQYGATLSLSHEDAVGGAVAWRDNVPFAFGMDVVDVSRVAQVRGRFPHFGARWMPRCQPAALDAVDVAKVKRTYGGCADPVDVVLAQHWGLRECCVKLVGIAGRSFPLECFRGPVALFPERFEAHVVGIGRAALHSVGLHSNLFVSLWPHLLRLPSGEQRPFVTVVAACPRARRR